MVVEGWWWWRRWNVINDIGVFDGIGFVFVAFHKAHDFNGDLSQWDVSKVTTLLYSKYLLMRVQWRTVVVGEGGRGT